jgi:hypothetical protein
MSFVTWLQEYTGRCGGHLVTYEVSYSNSNDSDEFPLAWNVPARDTKTFLFALQCYFISKTIRCFWHSLYMKDVHTNGGTNHQDLCQTLIMTFKWSKQICQSVHGPRLINYLILLIVHCSCGKCIKKPLPSLSKSATEIRENNYPFIYLQVTKCDTILYMPC